MKRTVILGGGFGGLAMAHTLRRLRPDDEIIVVDRAAHFIVGFRKTWALLGKDGLDAGRGQLADLANFGITFRQGTVTAIDAPARAVEVDGERLAADALVVALGARLAPEEVPGFAEHGLNIYAPGAIAQAREVLRDFSGGRVAVAVLGLPYKCPPAPYEIAIQVQDYFEQRGAPPTVAVYTPLPSSLPIAGAAGCNVIEGRLAERGIAFWPNHTAKAVESGELVFEDERRPFDLLLGIAPHRCPRVVQESGLAGDSGWVAVDPLTLETGHPGVYAIGDVTTVLMNNGKPLPKAGVFAEAQGQVVARRVAAIFEGRQPLETFEGRGGCFLEVGDGQALMVEGHFMAEAGPEVTLSPADARYLQQKEAFERERLQQWFETEN